MNPGYDVFLASRTDLLAANESKMALLHDRNLGHASWYFA